MDKSSTILSETIWQCQSFSQLSTSELYYILQLRNEVFVVEQNCAYQDCDEKDLEAYHLTAWYRHQLIAYTRLLPPGISYKDQAAIGRVVTSSRYRNLKIGELLMHKSIEEAYRIFGQVDIRISAQYHLKRFYENLSFVAVGATYPEDGIEHIAMELLI